MDPRLQPGILGTNASLMSDLTLLAYILLIVPAMLVGFFFARRKMFVPHHKLMMTSIILFNWVLILYLMQVSYRQGVAPNLPAGLSEPFNLLPTIHLITGGIAQLLGTYLVIRMWFEKVLPKWIMVKKIKRYMRATLALWLVTASLGIGIYLLWYSPGAAAEDNVQPAVTQEADTGSPDADAGSPDATPEPAMTEEASDGSGDLTPAPAETEDASASSSGSDDNDSDDDSDDDDIRPAETEEADDDNDDDNDSDDNDSDNDNDDDDNDGNN